MSDRTLRAFFFLGGGDGGGEWGLIIIVTVVFVCLAYEEVFLENLHVIFCFVTLTNTFFLIACVLLSKVMKKNKILVENYTDTLSVN